jgi:hypothetical protein
MKLVKSVIAATLLGLCANAQSMELIKAARAYPKVSAVLVASALYNTYQIKNTLTGMYTRNSLAKEHNETLEAIHGNADRINQAIQNSLPKNDEHKVKTSLKLEQSVVHFNAFMAGIERVFPKLAQNGRAFVALANAFNTEKSFNKATITAYNEAYKRLMDELNPMVQSAIVKVLKNGAAKTVVFAAQTALKYPKTTLAGVAGIALNQWIGNSISGTSKVLYSLGAASLIAAPMLALKYLNTPFPI